MKLFRRKKDGDKRTIYVLGLKVFSYTKKRKILNLKQAYDLPTYKSNNSDSCIVMVNGPSLNTALQDSKTRNYIETHPKMCVNGFAISEEFFALKPEYLVFADPAYWLKTENEDLQKHIDDILLSLEKVDWKLTIFMGTAAKEWHHFISLGSSKNNITFQYVNLINIKRDSIEENFPYYENNLEMPAPQNVGVLALFLAINMGYKEVFLLGANHDWHLNLIVKEDNKLYIKDTHFDDSNDVAYTPFYKEGSKQQTFTVKEIFEIMYTLHSSYEEIAMYANYKDVKIYNASNPSFIDVFERAKFE